MRSAWVLLHNLVAHPFLAVTEFLGRGVLLATRFHDWTADRAWPGPVEAAETRASVATLVDAAVALCERAAADVRVPLEDRAALRAVRFLLDDVQLAIAAGRAEEARNRLELVVADLREALAGQGES